MSAHGSLCHLPGSPVAPFVEALAWLWRLGPSSDAPGPAVVGIGAAREAGELEALVRAGRLSAAVVLATGSADEAAPLPARRVRVGVARFGSTHVEGEHTLFAGGHAAVRSSLGVHAVRRGDLLAIGADPAIWGRLDLFWVLEAIAPFLVERLRRPLVLLPRIGCLRLDDFPGTAELQLRGAAKRDSKQRRQAETMATLLERAPGSLVVAAPAHALAGDVEAPLDRVWPDAVAALARGVDRGVFEPACHGLLHLEPGAQEEGRVDPREFAHLDASAAGVRIDAACAWLRDHLGEPRSFVAPAWAYGPGAFAAASERGLPSWLPPEPAPLVNGLALHETLAIGLPGLHGVDYAPLERLAAIGLPPTVVLHGRLLDDRLPRLRAGRDLSTGVRLARRRDLERLIRLTGIRWIGASELLEQLRAHDAVEPADGNVNAEMPVAARLYYGRS
jgi:hypothetical protein